MIIKVFELPVVNLCLMWRYFALNHEHFGVCQVTRELHLLIKIERLIGYSIPKIQPGIDLGNLSSWDTKESNKEHRQPSGKNKRHTPDSDQTLISC